jgi:hypothetical protein
MSNEELIRKFYQAFKIKDMQTINQVCDESIEWNTLKGMPCGGKYVGLKATFEDYFSNMLSNFEEFHAIPEEFIESKDHVIVIGRYIGISKNGKKFDVPFSHVYLIQENKIKQFRQFTDTKVIQDSLN